MSSSHSSCISHYSIPAQATFQHILRTCILQVFVWVVTSLVYLIKKLTSKIHGTCTALCVQCNLLNQYVMHMHQHPHKHVQNYPAQNFEEQHIIATRQCSVTVQTTVQQTIEWQVHQWQQDVQLVWSAVQRTPWSLRHLQTTRPRHIMAIQLLYNTVHWHNATSHHGNTVVQYCILTQCLFHPVHSHDHYSS